jgi:hypothetical protein
VIGAPQISRLRFLIEDRPLAVVRGRAFSSSASPFQRQSLERPFLAPGNRSHQTTVTFTQDAVDFTEILRSSAQQKESAEPLGAGLAAHAGGHPPGFSPGKSRFDLKLDITVTATVYLYSDR